MLLIVFIVTFSTTCTDDRRNRYEGYKLSQPGVRHVAVGPNARKTLIVGNIINAGRLNVTLDPAHDGKIVVKNNVDDSPEHMPVDAATVDADSSSVVAELREKVARLEAAVEQLLQQSAQETS